METSFTDVPELPAPPASKRRRGMVEERRHPDLYFEDGNLVLSAMDEETALDHNTEHQIVTFFRVHRSILAKHSPVFRDMLAFPTPQDVERYDGVPHVRLYDSCDDLTGFLTAFYEPLYIPPEHYDGAFSKKMLGPLKLATKYQVDSLRARIISQVRKDWPSTLKAWDKRFSPMHDERGPSHPDPLHSINLAYKGGICDEIPTELGLMFYQLSVDLHPPDDLDTIASCLQLPAFLRLLKGRERLNSFMFKTIGEVVSLPCTKPECDQTAFWRHIFLDPSLQEFGWRGTRDPLGLIYMTLEYDGRLCHTCCREYCRRFKGCRQAIFGALPSLFRA
ncbi:hypothetical protein HGRIS_006794 [Hohenbuehelia grisea]|uniref:BTB domain-containing protein n=1 Tax=Hohenbuehelia grisea TaxID=104357 RepID=A0ABR3JA25_9AGAR